MAKNSWYVARVRIGAEENVRRRCQEQISPEVLKDCYVFHYEEKSHIHGVWAVQEKILFPGYVFLVANRIEFERIDLELRIIEGVLGILKIDDESAVFTDEEVKL